MSPHEFLYHGSTTPDIKEFEPRKRLTPGALGKDASPAVYATDHPAYAAAQSFPWSSSEGFDARFKRGLISKRERVVLIVPRKFKGRLNQKVYIYKLPGATFELIEGAAPEGHNFRSLVKVKPVDYKPFETVTKALIHFDGKIDFVRV